MCLQLIGYTYSVTLECYPTACLGLWLCHKLMADVFFFFQRPLMSWLLVLGSVTSAWRTHPVRLQASYLCDPNLNEVRNPNDQICGIFNIWKCMHYLQRRKRPRTRQERLSVWHHQRNRKFNPGLKQQPEWERLFQINGHCASFQTIPATGVESRVSSEEEKQSACPSETVPAENSSETRQLILSMNFCTEPSSCCLKSVPLLCNYKSLWTGVLPALSIFLFFYVKLSRVWTCSKAGTNTCIISCCCFRQSSLKY